MSEELRASDADRERLISELREHMAAGRLSVDELAERTQTAYAARTIAELDRLRRDLPAPPGQLALDHRTRRAHLARRAMQETGGTVGLFGVCTLIWLVSSGVGSSFWPVWILVLVVLSLVHNAWELYGPAPDLDAVEARLDAKRTER